MMTSTMAISTKVKPACRCCSWFISFSSVYQKWYGATSMFHASLNWRLRPQNPPEVSISRHLCPESDWWRTAPTR